MTLADNVILNCATYQANKYSSSIDEEDILSYRHWTVNKLAFFLFFYNCFYSNSFFYLNCSYQYSNDQVH